MKRFDFYRLAISNLGIRGLVTRQWAKKSGQDPLVLTSKYSRYPLMARAGSSDLFVFDQIFVDREYRCLDGLEKIQYIVDAGANVGYSSAYLLTKFPNAQVIAVEPDPENFVQLTRNLKPFGDRVHTLQAALWCEDTTLNFSKNFSGAGDEWARQVGPSADGDGDVRAISMRSLIEQFGWDRIDLLKMDIEGAEESVFGTDDISWMDRVGALVIEVHGPGCQAALDRALDGRGFGTSRCDELTVCLPVQAGTSVS